MKSETNVASPARSALALRRAETQSGNPPAAKQAILTAAERLLASVPLHELSVARISRLAGVSNPTFYSYFASKEDVLATLYLAVVPQIARAWTALSDRSVETKPQTAIVEGLSQLGKLWTVHAAVLCGATENRHVIAQIDKAYKNLVQHATTRISRQVDRDRATGIAPKGPASPALVLALIISSDQTFHVSFSGAHPLVIGPRAAVESLATMWLHTLYGRCDPWVLAKLPSAPGPPTS